MKASLAAIASAGAECARRGLRGDVIVAAVVDEEAASIGTEALLAGRRADAAIVAEPTDERLCIAHRGWLAFDIETPGRAAHGSRPDLGIDAIAKMGRVLVAIEELDGSLQSRPGHPLLGTGSVHASLIEGGQEYSSYPARCLLQGERRTIPGERREDVEAELRGLLGDSDGTIAFPFGRDPMEVSPDEEIVRAVQAQTGSDGGVRGAVLDRRRALHRRRHPGDPLRPARRRRPRRRRVGRPRERRALPRPLCRGRRRVLPLADRRRELRPGVVQDRLRRA